MSSARPLHVGRWIKGQSLREGVDKRPLIAPDHGVLGGDARLSLVPDAPVVRKGVSRASLVDVAGGPSGAVQDDLGIGQFVSAKRGKLVQPSRPQRIRLRRHTADDPMLGERLMDTSSAHGGGKEADCLSEGDQVIPVINEVHDDVSGLVFDQPSHVYLCKVSFEGSAFEPVQFIARPWFGHRLGRARKQSGETGPRDKQQRGFADDRVGAHSEQIAGHAASENCEPGFGHGPKIAPVAGQVKAAASRFELLIACIRSGQLSEAQIAAEMTDKAFAAYWRQRAG